MSVSKDSESWELHKELRGGNGACNKVCLFLETATELESLLVCF